MNAPARRTGTWLALVAVLTLAVHARALWGEPVFLDDRTVPWAETPGLDTGDTVSWTLSMLADPASRQPPAPWEPISAVLLSVTPAFGEQSVRAMHALALLAHAAAVLALGRLALTLGAGPPVALGAALLFGTHPVTVQGTAWISAFSAVLGGLFALLALDAFARARRSRRVSPVAGVFLLFGLLSSPVAFAALPMALVVGFAAKPGGDEPTPAPRNARTWSSFAPLAAACVVAWLVRAAVFESAAAGYADEVAAVARDDADLLVAAVESFGGALRILAWPDDPNLLRAPLVGVGLFDAPLVSAWGFAAGALLLLGLACWKRARVLATGTALLIAALLPLAAASDAMTAFPLSDHHLLLPLAGFALVVGALLAGVRGVPTVVSAALLALVAGAYGWLCQPRIATWHDDLTLLGTAAERNADLPYAQWIYAHELLFEYQQHGVVDDLHAAHDSILRAQELLERSKEPDATIRATSEDFLQTNLGLGWCLLALAEVDTYFDFETPAAVFEMISDSHPRNIQALLGSGLASIGLGDAAAAEASFRAALRIDPDSADALHDLGRLMIADSRWKEAERYFEKALLRRPSHREDRVWLARALFQQGWLDRARHEATRAHELDPYHPEAMVLLGVIALAQDRPSEAQDWIDRALRASPDDGFARLQRGRVFEARGDLQNAMFEYKRASEAMPRSFEALTSLGNSLLRLGRDKAAAEQLVRAYELRPPDGDLRAVRSALAAAFPTLAGAHFGFAGVDYARGDLAACNEWLASALAIEPRHAGALHLRGITLLDAGALDEALASFQAALASLPDSFQIRHDLGYVLVDLGRSAEALPHLRRALELVPPTPDAPDIASSIRQKLSRTIAELEGSG